MISIKFNNTIAIVSGVFFTLFSGIIFAQADSSKITDAYPVLLVNDTLFYLSKNIGSVSAQQRAKATSKKTRELAELTNFNPDSLKVDETDICSNIVYHDKVIHSVFSIEVRDSTISRDSLAMERMLIIRSSLSHYIDNHRFKIIAFRILIGLGVFLFLIFVIWLVNKFFRFLNENFIVRYYQYFKQLKIGNYELLSAQQVSQYVSWLLNGLRIFLTIIIIYITLPVIFRLFPLTESIANYMWDLIWNPIISIFESIINYIPNLFAIVVISFLFYYLNKILTYFAKEIETKKLYIKGFYAEWAPPTLSLIQFVVFVFYFIVIYRFLPGADSKVFQGVTVFIGLLVSIGSSSAISNIVAGLVITYMRPFKIGSYVKIGEVVGTVIEKNLLVTRIETIKNEEITIPNATVLSSYTLNYGSEKSKKLLIIHSTVTIGYNSPWELIHELLISAATATKFVVANPSPFVFQTGLNDFYISYQINAYTNMPNIQDSILSELHQNIQNKFNEAGVEIMSPHYNNLRDGNHTSIPENYLGVDYKIPKFNVEYVEKNKKS